MCGSGGNEDYGGYGENTADVDIPFDSVAAANQFAFGMNHDHGASNLIQDLQVRLIE